MKLLAQESIPVLDMEGRPDGGSRIFPGDLCTVGEPNSLGLWPVTYPTARGSKIRWVRSLKGFLVNQRNYGSVPYPAKGYARATVKSGGCGVCSAVMAVGALTGQRIAVSDMVQRAIRWGARVPGGTDMEALTRNLCREHDLARGQTNSLAALLGHLEGGGVAICNAAGNGMFSDGGHFMTVFGEAGGKLVIGDPNLYYGKFDRAGRREHVTVSGDLLLCKPEVLDADCVGRWPKYWLLERKAR